MGRGRNQYLPLSRQEKNEVDIVMERDDGKIFGVEVKASASVTQQGFKGLHELKLYGGDKYVRGNSCIYRSAVITNEI